MFVYRPPYSYLVYGFDFLFLFSFLLLCSNDEFLCFFSMLQFLKPNYHADHSFGWLAKSRCTQWCSTQFHIDDDNTTPSDLITFACSSNSAYNCMYTSSALPRHYALIQFPIRSPTYPYPISIPHI